MQTPIQLTINKDIPHTHDLETELNEKAKKLEQFCENIIACHIVVELVQKHKQQGKLYNVRIKLTVPGKELVANKNEDENLQIATREAFNDMKRQLEDYSRRVHGKTKTHPELLQGTVVRLFDEDDFGFIEGPNNTEYYFNSGNVVNPKFNKLKIGTPVHFIEAVGDEGLQAHRVSAEHE